MKRKELELAISELDYLLGNINTSEAEFQSWFEKHPVVFEAYGYSEFVLHPRLNRSQEEVLIPDFLAKRIDGIWEIVELKLPNALVARQTAWQNFYASFEAYCSQCEAYAEFFVQDALRAEFNKSRNLNVQRDVRSLVIASRRTSIDANRVHQLFCNRGSKISLQTYDDVSSRLNFYRASLYARDENLPGFFLYMTWVPEHLTNEANWILDFGISEKQNRLSLYLTEQNELALDIYSSSGEKYPVRAPLTKSSVVYHKPMLLVIQIGIAQDDTVVSIEIDGQHFFDRKFDNFQIDPENFKHVVIGSDFRGKANSHFSIKGYGFGLKTLTFEQRQKLLLDLISDSKSFSNETKMVEFKSYACMATKNHPVLINAGDQERAKPKLILWNQNGS